MNDTTFHTYRAHPDLALTLCDLGASIYGCKFQGVEMTYTTDETTFALPNKEFFGQFVGPVAGRIKNGKLREFTFAQNEGTNAHHSSQYRWCWLPFERSVEETPEGIVVRFIRRGELFGGKFEATATYTLYRSRPAFRVCLGFVSTADCPCNLTCHAYWSLGEEDAANIFVKMPTTHVMSYEPGGIPAKYVKSSGIYDFTEGRKLNQPYDHAILLKEGEMEAWGDRFGMKLHSDANAAQLYVDVPSKQRLGHSAGFAFECERHTTMDESMILPAGVKEETTIEYEFYRRESND